jgi:hypothetical protein
MSFLISKRTPLENKLNWNQIEMERISPLGTLDGNLIRFFA